MSVQPKKISELDDASVSALATKMEMKVSKVHVFEFENVTGTSSITLDLPGLTKAMVGSSIVLCCLNKSTEDESYMTWIPNVDSSGTFIIRTLFYSVGKEPENPLYKFLFRTHNWTGTLNTTSKTWRVIRIFVIQLIPES